MKQPELGKYIVELREARGLTQEELVSQCNISVRTLQRIESGKVMPRSYTLRVIFTALDCDYLVIPEAQESRKPESFNHSLLKSVLKDLFNLKIHTMTKLTIFMTVCIAIGFSLYTGGAKCNAQQMKKMNFVTDNTGGYEILLPRGLSGYGSYINQDTIFIRAGKDLIKEYKGTLFLNNSLVGQVKENDTIIFRKRTLFAKKSLIIKPYIVKASMIYNGIVYVTSQPISGFANSSGETFRSGAYTFWERDNKIYLNDVYQGDVFTGDTVVISRLGKLAIKHGRRTN